MEDADASMSVLDGALACVTMLSLTVNRESYAHQWLKESCSRNL